nr:LysR substrate-binding domain-containing protein [Phytoactinopolyspora alkaliphila]
MLVARAEEIIGRVDSAQAELAAHAGLQTGRVRLAAFPSALATLVPPAAAEFATRHPGLELALTESEPPESLDALRNGAADVALVFEYDAPRPQPTANVTSVALLDEPLYIVTPARETWPGAASALSTYAGERWIAGCERCRAHLLVACEAAGFTPTIEFETDDYVAAQALVAAGIGVTTLPGLALLANRHNGVRITRMPRDRRRVLAVTYGKPPLPGPVQAFLDVLSATVHVPVWPR